MINYINNDTELPHISIYTHTYIYTWYNVSMGGMQFTLQLSTYRCNNRI